MNILGVSALYHDSAAALVCDGEIIAAAQEERFTRKKADASIPVNAINYCLSLCKGVDAVVYYDNPFLTLDRYLTNVSEVSPENEAIIDKSFRHTMSERLWVHDSLRRAIGVKWSKDKKLKVCEHHISHAASAFYPSPFSEAAILTVDGVGEWATAAIGIGRNTDIEILEQINYPDSIGLLYSAFTYFCGFKVNLGEYKLMGLAPYGEPKYAELIKKEIVNIEDDGCFSLNQKYFKYMKEDALISEDFCALFNTTPREPESTITRDYMDIAASVQKVTEELITGLALKARRLTGCKRLVMAGGSALNCAANGVLLKSGIFEDIWVQPAAGDAGGALGCALYYGYNRAGWKRELSGTETYKDAQKGSYLGPSFSNEEIKKYLDSGGCKYHYLDDKELFQKTAEFLADGRVIGLFHGRMEYGPRALGNRSIIASALHEDMQRQLNLKIKFRESFRPFAPAVIEEDAHKYFDLKAAASPYMLFTAPVKAQYRQRMRAVTHVDFSARVQTVNKRDNPYFYGLLSSYREKTGCGVIVNTSFNVRGEPLVCTPKDAFICFMRTNMDVLIMENYILLKEEQDRSLFKDTQDWKNNFELD